jgi:tetratricopeptide (TPR) repeat protein
MHSLKRIIFFLCITFIISSCFRRGPEDYCNQGEDEFMSQNYEEAIRDLNKAISLDSCSSKAYNARAAVYFNTLNYPMALDDYSRAIRFNPNFGSAFRLRGVVKVTTGDTTGAMEDWKEAGRLGDLHAQFYLHKYKKRRPREE